MERYYWIDIKDTMSQENDFLMRFVYNIYSVHALKT